MSEFSTADARNNFSDVVNRAGYGKERVVLTRHGRRVAAVIPIEDLELLERIEDRLDLEAARAALAEDAGETVAWEEVKRGLGLA